MSRISGMCCTTLCQFRKSAGSSLDGLSECGKKGRAASWSIDGRTRQGPTGWVADAEGPPDGSPAGGHTAGWAAGPATPEPRPGRGSVKTQRVPARMLLRVSSGQLGGPASAHGSSGTGRSVGVHPVVDSIRCPKIRNPRTRRACDFDFALRPMANAHVEQREEAGDAHAARQMERAARGGALPPDEPRLAAATPSKAAAVLVNL